MTKYVLNTYICDEFWFIDNKCTILYVDGKITFFELIVEDYY